MIDPIGRLMEDHRAFLETVRSFRLELEAHPRESPWDASLPRRLLGFARFLELEVDRRHGQLEERGLFPVLGRYLPVEGGPIGVMLGEHEALRGLQRGLLANGRKLESDLAALEATTAAVASTRAVEELLVTHVIKEDSVLFPMAHELLSPREVEEVRQRFEEVEAALPPR